LCKKTNPYWTANSKVGNNFAVTLFGLFEEMISIIGIGFFIWKGILFVFLYSMCIYQSYMISLNVMFEIVEIVG